MDVAEAQMVGSVCLGLHVRRAARILARRYDDALQPFDLTIGQFSLMTMLRARDRWSMQPLADALGTDRSSLTAALKPLERRALVESMSDPEDKRLRYPVLTNAGNALLGAALESWRDVQGQMEATLSPQGANDLRSILAKLP